MGKHVVVPSAWHHRDVRLRLGFVVESDGHLASYDPPGAKAQPQRIFDQTDRGRVKSALRLADDEGAAEQLEMLSGREDPQIDQTIVFDAGPASHALG